MCHIHIHVIMILSPLLTPRSRQLRRQGLAGGADPCQQPDRTVATADPGRFLEANIISNH